MNKSPQVFRMIDLCSIYRKTLSIFSKKMINIDSSSGKYTLVRCVHSLHFQTRILPYQYRKKHCTLHSSFNFRNYILHRIKQKFRKFVPIYLLGTDRIQISVQKGSNSLNNTAKSLKSFEITL